LGANGNSSGDSLIKFLAHPTASSTIIPTEVVLMIADLQVMRFADGRLAVFIVGNGADDYHNLQNTFGPNLPNGDILDTDDGNIYYLLEMTPNSGFYRRRWIQQDDDDPTHPRRIAVGLDGWGQGMLFSLIGIDTDPNDVGDPDAPADDFENGQVFYSYQSSKNGEWMSWGWTDRIHLGGTKIREITAATAGSGEIGLIAVGSDLKVYASMQVKEVGTGQSQMTAWSLVGGNNVQYAPVVQGANGQLQIFTLDANGAVAWVLQDGQGWAAPIPLGGNDFQRISVATIGGGPSAVFGLRTNQSVEVQLQTGQDTWSGWQSLQGVGLKQVVGAVNTDGRFEVFVLGGNLNIYHRWQDENHDWTSDWADLGGLPNVRGFAVTSEQDGSLSVIAITAESTQTDLGIPNFFNIKQVAPNGGWGDWTTLPSDPSGYVYVGAQTGGP
jgi:hypothetical protein